MNIELIPYGKENKISRRSLMKLANIQDENTVDKEMIELRRDNIIMSNSKDKEVYFWRSDSKEELQEFIKKYQHRSYDTSKIIMLAYKELDRMEGKTNEM